MSDPLLQINKKSLPGQLLMQAGVPLPTKLERYKDSWPERPLENKVITVGGAGELQEALTQILPAAGAEVHTLAQVQNYDRQAEAWARPVKELSGTFAHDKYKTNGLVFDATAIKTIAELERVYEFLHLYIRKIKANGRIVILARPAPSALTFLSGQPNGSGHRKDGDSLAYWEEGSVNQALIGLVKGLAKEIGGKGSTANLLYVQPGAEPRLEGALRFFLSPAAAFITAQPITITAALQHEPEGGIPHRRILEGKTILLTGAGRGIGATTAEILRREGARLIALDRPDDRDALAKVVSRVGGTMLLQDIAAADAADNIIQFVNDEFGGKLDGVVHNAGVTRDKTIGKMDPGRWNSCIDINLKSVVHITDRLTKSVMGPGSRVLVTASISGIAGNFGQTNYGAAKAGLIGFVHTAASALAEKGIALNAVAPGFIETAMTGAIPLATREGGRRLSAMGQGGLPEDVGQAAAFLCSDAAYGLTGQVLRICGANFLGA